MEYVFSGLILSLSIILSYKIKIRENTIWYVNDIKREIHTYQALDPFFQLYTCKYSSLVLEETAAHKVSMLNVLQFWSGGR